jgi:hypothetical protein
VAQSHVAMDGIQCVDYESIEYILVDAKDNIIKDYIVMGKDCNVAVKYHVTMDDICCVHYNITY